MAKIGNRVLQTTVTTGTGTLDLGAAVAGHQTFIGSADIATGDDVWYGIVDSLSAPTLYEIGRNTITAGSPDTLLRTSGGVEESSNANALVSLPAGTKYVFSAMSYRALIDQMRSAGLHVGTTGGSGTAFTATPNVAIPALVTGTTVIATLHAACGAAPTFAPSSLTAKSLRKNVGGTDVALAANDTAAGFVAMLLYDAALNAAAGGWMVMNLPSAATVTINAQAGAYTALAADRGKLIDITAAGTLSLTAAATLGAGWFCYVRNSVAASAIAIDPNSSELIDGAATQTLVPGETCLVVCDGSAFKTAGRALPLPPGARNLAGRNGGLEIWQRGAGGSASIAVAASTTAYTADGWALKTGANQASVVDQVAGIATGSRFAARVRRNSGQTGTGTMSFEFPLTADEIAAAQSSKVTLSMVLKAGANWSPTSGNLTIELRTGTGSPAKRSAGAYTGDAADIAQTQAITTTATRYSYTSAAALGAAVTQASIYLTWTPTGTAGAADDFTIDDVQLEVASAASSFERRSFEAELAACEFHYEKTYDYATAPGATTTNGAEDWLAYATSNVEWRAQSARRRKRATPTVTLWSTTGASGNIRNTTDGSDLAVTPNNIGETGFTLPINATASKVYKWHATIDAGI